MQSLIQLNKLLRNQGIKMDKTLSKLKAYSNTPPKNKKVPPGKDSSEKNVSKPAMARQKASEKQADKKLNIKVDKKLKK
jgi:hypothetical protein